MYPLMVGSSRHKTEEYVRFNHFIVVVIDRHTMQFVIS